MAGEHSPAICFLLGIKLYIVILFYSSMHFFGYLRKNQVGRCVSCSPEAPKT